MTARAVQAVSTARRLLAVSPRVLAVEPRGDAWVVRVLGGGVAVEFVGKYADVVEAAARYLAGGAA